MPKFEALAASYEGELDDDAPIEAALARLSPPRTPDMLLEKLVALGVGPGELVLDLGCGHGQYAEQIAATIGCRVVAVDLSVRRAAETRERMAPVERERVHVARAMAEWVPLRAGSIDIIWCRDMLYHVDLPRTLGECASALVPRGHMIAYQSFATELMEPREAQRLYAATGVPDNFARAYFEARARDAGFEIIERDEIRSEWRESEALGLWERGGGGLGAGLGVTEKLLRAARLVRGGEGLRHELGDAAYEAALSDCLWFVYQMIGKLCPTSYVLRRE